MLLALESGADVVTGNKALLATHGPELFAAAEQVGAQLYYEAAVGGAIPIIRPLRDSLAGDRVRRILGIVNGTTNFVLDRMDEEGLGFDAALAEATRLGYAEADPTADVEGYDAAQKAAILAGLAFHTTVPLETVYREGITGVTADAGALRPRRPGYVVKLLAICERITDAATAPRASRPACIRRCIAAHPSARRRARREQRRVRAGRGRRQPHVLRRGRRRRPRPRPPCSATSSPPPAGTSSAAPASPSRRTPTCRCSTIGGVGPATRSRSRCADQPGVLARSPASFSERGVSIETVEQSESRGSDGTATLVIGTHRAREAALAATVAALRDAAEVEAVLGVLRVEGT